MTTTYSNTTPEGFAKRVAELRKRHKEMRRLHKEKRAQTTGRLIEPPLSPLPPINEDLYQMIAQFDTLLDSGDDEAADELGRRIWRYELRRARAGKPCGKTPLANNRNL